MWCYRHSWTLSDYAIHQFEFEGNNESKGRKKISLIDEHLRPHSLTFSFFPLFSPP